MAFAEGVVPNLDEGTKELRVAGSYDGDHPLDYQAVLDLGFGYFIMDNVEVGCLLGWQGNDVFDLYEVGAFAEYNFDLDSPIVPFVQVGALWVGAEVDDDIYNDSNSIDEDAWAGRFGAGVKYFIRDGVALALEGVYDIASEDVYADDDGDVDDYNWQALLGLRIYWD
jgi:hypothetical protein